MEIGGCAWLGHNDAVVLYVGGARFYFWNTNSNSANSNSTVTVTSDDDNNNDNGDNSDEIAFLSTN